MSFTDGKIVVPMVSSMDHKRAHDNDEGQLRVVWNYRPQSILHTDAIAAECMENFCSHDKRRMNNEHYTYLQGLSVFRTYVNPKMGLKS